MPHQVHQSMYDQILLADSGFSAVASAMGWRRTGFRDSPFLLKGIKKSKRRMAAELWRADFGAQ
jgi:hypothetical protein